MKQKGKHWMVPLLGAAVCAVCLTAGCGKLEPNASDYTWGQADAKEIDINSKVYGRVITLNVKEGDRVKKGDVMATIDPRSLEAEKAQRVANIAYLKAQRERAGKQTVLQQGTTQAALDKASADLARRKSEYERYEKLISVGAVSKTLYDDQKTAYENAQAAYDNAQADLNQNAVNEAQEKSLDKQIQQAEASLEATMVSLDDTVIRAPFDGIITDKYVEEGSMVTSGTPLVAVQDDTDNWVDVKVPETDLSKYAVGQQVKLLARDNVTTVTGTITDISKKAEFATTKATSERGSDADIISFNMKIQVDSPILRPGMRFRLMGESS